MLNLGKQLYIYVSKKGDKCLIEANCVSFLALENKFSFTPLFSTAPPLFYNKSIQLLKDK